MPLVEPAWHASNSKTAHTQGDPNVKQRTAALAGAVLLAAASSASGAEPTFKAAVEGNTLVIYSTSAKDVACYTMVTFSFKSGDERTTRRYVCNGFALAKKDHRFCERTDPDFVDLKIEGPVSANC
jgi:hypothetical protein